MKELLRGTIAYRSFAEGKDVSHATLIVFPDEAYLRVLLKECAKAFFCAADGTRVAELVEKETYSDCLILPASGEKWAVDLGVKIIDESLLRPVECAKKLFVLDAFHTASALVQNKLLKVLEEPPAGVYFLLGATAEYSVLPTVLSRMKKIIVPPFSEESVKSALMRITGGASGIGEAAAACGGVLSAAQALLAGGGEDFRLAEKFFLGENIAASRAAGERKEKKSFLSALKLVLRDALFFQTGQEEYAARRSDGIGKIAREYPASALLKGMEHAVWAEKQINLNAPLAQCLETLFIGMEEEKKKWQRLS